MPKPAIALEALRPINNVNANFITSDGSTLTVLIEVTRALSAEPIVVIDVSTDGTKTQMSRTGVA